MLIGRRVFFQQETAAVSPTAGAVNRAQAARRDALPGLSTAERSGGVERRYDRGSRRGHIAVIVSR